MVSIFLLVVLTSFAGSCPLKISSCEKTGPIPVVSIDPIMKMVFIFFMLYFNRSNSY